MKRLEKNFNDINMLKDEKLRYRKLKIFRN